MTFYDELATLNYGAVRDSFEHISAREVAQALAADRLTLQDFAALISPAAAPYLNQMAAKAHALTVERFGRVVQMYIPLYLSNYCTNSCVYCGFNHANKILRKKLSLEEVDAEVAAIKELGYEHILLVAGEHPREAGPDYYEAVIRRIRPHFAQISIEVQPLETAEYARLREAGASYVCVYQETYNRETYPKYHPHGLKADFRYRLETPERAAAAGIKKVGIGALLGLDDWRTDAFCTAMHLRYLEKHCWQTKYSVSLPRLRPHVGAFMPTAPISDRELMQLICAYRLFDAQIEISMSTRESAAFRDKAILVGATSVSAQSSTQPGGYVHPQKELEQFAINDTRTTQEMREAIIRQGYEPVWKDWDAWIS